MKQQTLIPAQKESIPSQMGGLLPHAAVRAIPEHEKPSNGSTETRFGYDFSRVAVRSSAPIIGQDYSNASCPMFPQRCPFGGACHTCPPRVQAKLKIGQPGDKYEQEAERVADIVMRMPESQGSGVRGQWPVTGKNHKPMQRAYQLIAGINIQRISSTGSDTLLSYQDIKLNKSGGRSLSYSIRRFMEPRFDADFSSVRVHTGHDAHQTASQIQARAFTYGNHIWLGKGANEGDKRLMAHELTHVVQQKSEHAFKNDKVVKGIHDISNNNISTTIYSQFPLTFISPMIQFQRYRGCTPGITGAPMTQDEIDNLILGSRMSGELLVILADTAVDRIRAGTGSATEVAAFASHFGAPTPAQITTISNRFTIIRRRLSSDRLFICNTVHSAYCRRGWCAYVGCPGGRNLMHICPPYFQDPYPCQEPDTDSAMIHESAHAAGACNDVYPGAGYPPANAHNNAPAYAGFARAVFP